MKRRILTVFTSVVLSIVLCVVSVASTPVVAVTAFIDEELKTVMETATADELIPVDVWLTEIDTQEVETQVMKTAGLNKESIMEDYIVSVNDGAALLNTNAAITETNISLTAEQVDLYVETEREIYAEMQASESQAFLNKYKSIFASRSSAEEKLLFVSKYSPVIRAELTCNEINNLSVDASVEALYYSPNVVVEDESDISIAITQADYVRDTFGYTGSGIKIGMVEGSGMPNRQHDYFTTENIIYDPNVTMIESAHANQVAAIMVGKETTVNGVTYEGIAPDAKLYATYYDSDDWRERVEWLLSQGVNVINMSARLLDGENGKYDEYALWTDHIAINHSVHFVKSAGNSGEGDKYITSPGMAYNVITVGSINDNNTISYADDELSSFSSYNEQNIYNNNKPDLVASGTGISTAASTVAVSGTSFSAPQVTAIIAQLCDRNPTLCLYQDAMKAILMAAISHSEHAYDSMSTEFEKYGAGVVEARSAMSMVSGSRYVSTSFAANTAENASHSYQISVTNTAKPLRISLAWLRYAYISGTHLAERPDTLGLVADLQLYLYGPDGNLTASSCSEFNNTEVIHIANPVAGTYTIKVVHAASSSKKVYYTVAWW